jgi:hypothetical protein
MGLLGKKPTQADYDRYEQLVRDKIQAEQELYHLYQSQINGLMQLINSAQATPAQKREYQKEIKQIQQEMRKS